MSEELKFCPHCNGVANLHFCEDEKNLSCVPGDLTDEELNNENPAYVQCVSCMAQVAGESAKEAIATWNKRVEPVGGLTVEEAATAIRIICCEHGCPPDTDCYDKQDCHKCYERFLKDKFKPVENDGNKNKPLTLVELRGMDNELVWCVSFLNRGLDGCGLVNADLELIYDNSGDTWEMTSEFYGVDYVAYRRKPQG